MSGAILVLAALAGETIPRESDIPRKIRREENEQRRIARRTGTTSGEFGEIVEEYLYNRLADDSGVRRLRAMSEKLSSLEERDMPEAGDKLRSSSVPRETTNVRSGLFQATLVQSRIIRALRELLEGARKEFGPLEAARDLSQLIRDQERLKRETQETANETLGQEREKLDEEERARLEHLSEAQEQLREDLNDTRKELEDMAQESPEIADALQALDQARVPDQMTDASEDIDANRMHSAMERQADILQALQRTQEAFQRQGEEDPLAQLEGAHNQLLSMIQQEQNLRDMTEDLPGNAEAERFDELQQEQAGIERELGELTSDLMQSRSSLEEARRHMRNAERQLGTRQRQQASQEMQQALQMMQQSSQELARTMQELQSQRAQMLAQRMQQMRQVQRTKDTRDYQPGQMGQYTRLSEAKAGEGWDVSLQDLEPGEVGSAGGEKFPERYSKLLRLYYLNTSGAGRR